MRAVNLTCQGNALYFKAEEGSQRWLDRLPSTTFADNFQANKAVPGILSRFNLQSLEDQCATRKDCHPLCEVPLGAPGKYQSRYQSGDSHIGRLRVTHIAVGRITGGRSVRVGHAPITPAGRTPGIVSSNILKKNLRTTLRGLPISIAVGSFSGADWRMRRFSGHHHVLSGGTDGRSWSRSRLS